MSSILINKKLCDINEKEEDDYKRHRTSAKTKSINNVFLFKLNYESDKNLTHNDLKTKLNQRIHFTRSSREPNLNRYSDEIWSDHKRFTTRNTENEFIQNLRLLNSAHPVGRNAIKIQQKSMEILDFKTNFMNMNIASQDGNIQKWSSHSHMNALSEKQQQQQQPRTNSAIVLNSKRNATSPKKQRFTMNLSEIKQLNNYASRSFENQKEQPLTQREFYPHQKEQSKTNREGRSSSVMYERPVDSLRSLLQTPHTYTQMNEDHGYLSKTSSDYVQSPHEGTESPDVYTRVGHASNINVYSNLQSKSSPKLFHTDVKKSKKRNNLILTATTQTQKQPADTPSSLKSSSNSFYNTSTSNTSLNTKNPPATDMKPPSVEDLSAGYETKNNSTKKNEFFKYIVKQKTSLKSFLTSQLQSKNKKNKSDVKPIPLKRTLSKYEASTKLNDFHDEKIKHFPNCIITDIKIGEGEFGETFQGFRYDFGGPVKIAAKRLKSLSKRRAVDEERTTRTIDNNEILAEVRVLSLIGKHENVIEFYGVHTLKDTTYMIFEYAEKGDLKKLLDNARSNIACEINLNLLWKLKFAYEIACGMEYISSIGIVHKDLAARNILLTNEYCCKIADFGCLKSDFMTKCPIRWMAPECFNKSFFTSASDVWSFGVVMWEIWTLGLIPYPGMNDDEIFTRINQWYRLYQPQECPDEIYNIMKSCWKEHYKARPKFKQLMQTLRTIYQTNIEIIDNNIILK